MGMGPHMAVVAGNDERLGDRPFVNQMFLGSAGGPGSPDGRRLADVPDPRVRVAHLQGQHRGRRAALPDPRLRAAPRARQRGRGTSARGLGSVTVYGPKKRPMSVAYSLEAQQNPSRGVRGGLASPPTEVWMLNAAGERVEVPPVAALELQPGERIVSVSAGGGGYGDPFTRDPRRCCTTCSRAGSAGSARGRSMASCFRSPARPSTSPRRRRGARRLASRGSGAGTASSSEGPGALRPRPAVPAARPDVQFGRHVRGHQGRWSAIAPDSGTASVVPAERSSVGGSRRAGRAPDRRRRTSR